MRKASNKWKRPTVSYRNSLLTSLRDPAEAAGYLNAVLVEGDPAAFVLALRYVAEAHGLDELAARTL